MSDMISTTRSMIEMQLHYPVSDGNYEAIHGLLNAAKQNRIDSLIVLNKYVELAQFYNSGKKYRDSIELLLDAFELSQTSIDIFDIMGESLALYVIKYKDEFCDEDIRWVGTAIEYLHSINEGPQGAHHQLNRNPGILKIEKVIKTIQINNDEEAETSHTHFLSSISLKQYQNLTPEERRKKVSEIFARKLLELKKAKKGKGAISDA